MEENTTTEERYPDFRHSADQLRVFFISGDTFVIGLKNGGAITFTPNGKADFKAWLTANQIIDIS